MVLALTARQWRYDGLTATSLTAGISPMRELPSGAKGSLGKWPLWVRGGGDACLIRFGWALFTGTREKVARNTL